MIQPQYCWFSIIFPLVFQNYIYIKMIHSKMSALNILAVTIDFGLFIKYNLSENLLYK